MQSIKGFLTNYKLSIPLAVIILGGGIFLATRGGEEVKNDSVAVKKTTVAQEVSVTGRVVPAQDVELSAQSGGKVSVIAVKVGDTVTAGQTLLRIDDADLRIRLGRQQAALQKAQLTLSKAEPKTNSEDDLRKAYEDAFNTISATFLDIPNILIELDDIINDFRHSPELRDEYLRSIDTTAFNQKRDLEQKFSQMEIKYNALFPKYQSLTRSASPTQMEAVLNETYTVVQSIADVVKKASSLIDYVENKGANTYQVEMDTDQSTLNEFTTDTNAHLTAILEIKDTINDARTGITDEESDVKSLRIEVEQARLDVQDTQVQIRNKTIVSPIAGIVTKVDAKVGETISTGAAVISVISEGQFEIEANVPEADTAKIKAGADADVTLDAYGNDVVFKAKLVTIDPAETIVDGVATYKTTFQFIDKDERVKSGMTASVIVYGEKKENVLAIPARAVVTKNGVKVVQVIEGELTVDKTVETGLRGSDGNIEILSGLKEGEQVIVFTQK